jgi:hypothetical protein
MALPSIGSTLTGTGDNLDEFGNPKQKTQSFSPLPLTSPGQNVQLQDQSGQNQPAASSGTGSFDPNKPLGGQVVQKAQETALQGPQTATANLVSQQTQNLLKDPNAGVNYDKYNQGQMEQFDFNQQKALEAQRQKSADISNTGQNLYDLTDLALKTNLDRSNLSNNLNKQSQEQARANLVSALSEGRSTAATEQAGFGAQLSGLASAQQTGSQASDQAFQWAMKSTDQAFSKQMQDMQNKFNAGQTVSAQDFQAAQDSLNRQQQLAVQNNDIQAQQNIATLQNQLAMQRDKQAQSAQASLQSSDQAFQWAIKQSDQAFSKEMQDLQNKFTSGQTVSAQDFQSAQASLDRQQQLAVQNNDMAAQKNIATLQNQLAMQRDKQQQDFQAALQQKDQAFQWATKQSDQAFSQQMQELQNKFAEGQTLSSQDFQAAQASLDRQKQFAMQTNDINAQQNITALQNNLAMQRDKQNNEFQTQLKSMDITAQTDLTNLKAQIDSGAMMKSQDFEKGMETLKEQFTQAMADKDTAKQIQILNMQQSFEAEQTQKQKEYNTAERVATQAFTSNEKISDQDFQKAQTLLDQQFKDAQQSKDADLQKYIQQQQTQLQLSMQMNGFNDSQKKMYLQNQFDTAKQTAGYQQAQGLAQQAADLQAKRDQILAQIDEAKAGNDNTRAQQLMILKEGLDKQSITLQGQLDGAQKDKDYQHAMSLQSAQDDYDFKKLQSAQGHDVAMASLDNRLQQALQNNEFSHAIDLQAQKYAETAIEHDKDLAMEKLKTDLTAKGLNMQQWEQNYNAIMAQEDAGTAQPGAARAYLNAQLQGTGVQLQAPDPADQYKAITQDYKTQQIQYGLTHRDQVTGFDENGVPTGLTRDGMDKFNSFLNGLQYNESGANNLNNIYNTGGVSEALNTLGASGLNGKSAGMGSVFYNAGAGGTNVNNDKIAGLSSSELMHLTQLGGNLSINNQITGGNGNLSQNEISTVKSIAQNELNRRNDIIKKINGSPNLTDTQKADMKSNLGLIDIGW